MKAIIIDDEKKGREILHTLIQQYCEEVEVLGSAENSEKAYELIIKNKPDVIFLDIEMPDGDGFSLLERFDDIPFQVIFTTAYDQYAIKAIKYHALDYLLKPFAIEDLQSALSNVRKFAQSDIIKNRYIDFLAAHRLTFSGRVALPIKDGVIYLMICDIIRIESDGSYSTFYTNDGQYMVSKNLKEYEDLMPSEFFRVHKSHLINIKKVKKYLRTDGYFAEMQDGSKVEISRRKKDEFLQIMNDHIK
jgi:two-component system, LytTR family, response regulator